jgi:signal recognition particle subunit SRP19
VDCELKLQAKRVVWPANLDSTKSRKDGRKLPKGSSVQTPRLDEMNEAAKRLQLEVEVVPTKSRPRTWWEKGGYLILPKEKTKTQLLRSLASEVRKHRSQKSEHQK